MRRTLVFVAVGCAGFLVQLLALEGMTTGFGLHPALATGCAVELVVLHNFAWHERWTWSDRSTADPGGIWRRLGRFHATNGLVSLVGNVAITSAIVATTSVPLLLANAAAVGVCTVLNFVAADRLVFRSLEEVEA